MKRKTELQADIPKALLVMDVAEDFPTFVEMSRLEGDVSQIEVRSPNQTALRDCIGCVMAMLEALQNAYGAEVARAVDVTSFLRREKPPFEGGSSS